MLVVSRKIGETVVVPESNLEFTVLEIRGNRVRIGITAPPTLRVHRRELWERLCKEAAATAGNGSGEFRGKEA